MTNHAPNYKELCAKVLAYNESKGQYNFSQLDSYDRDNAAYDAWQEIKAELKHALAEPEPDGPTDQKILEVLDRATADFPPNHPEAEPMTAARYALTLGLPMTAARYALTLGLRKARAILARWVRLTLQGDLSDEDLSEPLGDLIDKWCQEGMQVKPHGTPFPLAHYVASRAFQYGLCKGRPPQEPVPVSERLPGHGDCDAEGRSWLIGPKFFTWDLNYPPKTTSSTMWTHWLPAHALPLPRPH